MLFSIFIDSTSGNVELLNSICTVEEGALCWHMRKRTLESSYFERAYAEKGAKVQGVMLEDAFVTERLTTWCTKFLTKKFVIRRKLEKLVLLYFGSFLQIVYK